MREMSSLTESFFPRMSKAATWHVRNLLHASTSPPQNLAYYPVLPCTPSDFYSLAVTCAPGKPLGVLTLTMKLSLEDKKILSELGFPETDFPQIEAAMQRSMTMYSTGTVKLVCISKCGGPASTTQSHRKELSIFLRRGGIWPAFPGVRFIGPLFSVRKTVKQ